MSFIINQNFDLKSPQFNFARDYFDNLAKLKAADENNFPDHFITNVAGDLYQLNKSYTPNDTTGKWRKYKPTNATYADTAGSATSATTATSAGTAKTADHATSATTASSATKATQDANGNNIAGTYLTKTTASSTYATKSDVSALSSALVYKGTIGTDGTITTTDVPAKVGDVYVAVAGAPAVNGVALEPGDMIIAKTAGDGTTTHATWTAVQTNINGAVTTTNTLTDSMLIVGANNKSIRAANGTGFVKVSSGSVYYDNSTYLDSVPKATTTAVGGGKVVNVYDGTASISNTDPDSSDLILEGLQIDSDGSFYTPVIKYTTATASKDGLMSSSDKVKLNRIQYPTGVLTSQLDLCGFEDYATLVNAVANQKDGLSFWVSDQNAIVTLQTDNGKHAIIQTIRTATELNNSWEFAAGATSSHKDGALFTYQRFYPIGGTYSTNTHNKWTKWAIIDVDTMYTDGRTNMNTVYKAKGKQLLSNLTVDKNGKITFSSVYSGIDATGIKSESNDILTPIPESEITKLFN